MLPDALTSLDIFNDLKPIDDIKEYTAFRNLPDLMDIPTIGLDIETAGLDPDNDRIYMIGMIMLDRSVKILYHENEKIILTKFAIVLSQVIAHNIVYIYGHNIFAFDLPFIKRRCELHNVTISFTHRIIDGHPLQRAFRVGGSYPIVYTEIVSPQMNIIDTLMLTRLNDAKWLFTDHTLKTVAIEIGARAERRLDLTHTAIKDAWAKADYGLIDQYLRYDLEDTFNIFYKFIPPYYYMQSYLPMTMQEVVLSGNASKVESMLRDYYRKKAIRWYHPPVADPKRDYEGALTMARPGLFKRVIKFDVSSQYPFIMLFYRCGTPDKDPDGVFFSVLKTLRNRRLQYKKAGQTDFSDALKMGINSAYGMLGSERKYNNPDAAERVCAYGRLIVSQMILLLEQAGAIVIEVDTDGVIFQYDKNANELLNTVLAGMPAGLEIENEFEARWVYIDSPKNYIVALDNKIIKKGKYRKRNATPLYIEFTLKFLELYYNNPVTADDYFHSINNTILARTLDVKKLTVHRTISKAEKYCLRYGNVGEKIDVYRGYDENKKPSPVIDGPYHTVYYVGEVTKWHKAIMANIETLHDLKESAKKD